MVTKIEVFKTKNEMLIANEFDDKEVLPSIYAFDLINSDEDLYTEILRSIFNANNFKSATITLEYKE